MNNDLTNNDVNTGAQQEPEEIETVVIPNTSDTTEGDAASTPCHLTADTQTAGRSTQFTIVKAIAIICVVLSHAGISGWLSHFVYIFHVPIFFLCAGYFFHTKYLDDDRTFIVHRIKGLYWPFLRWSVFFLIIHNLLFTCGILSEQYGNISGGVLHPYNWHQWCQHLWSIVFNMSGYNDFLCGTFWFFRALLLSSIAFLILFKLLRRSEHFKNYAQIGWGMLIIGLALTFWKVAEGINVSGVAQGGYRELMGLSFMAAGFLIRQYKLTELVTWKTALPCFGLLILASFLFPSSMTFAPSLTEFLSLPVPATATFIALVYACGFIDRHDNVAKRSLVYIGDRTLYIFAFHLVAFKLVSALKVAFYGLPWQAVGGHPTVLQPESNVLWILLYLIAGVGLPLLWLYGYQHIASRVSITEKQAVGLAITAGQKLFKILTLIGKGLYLIVLNSCRNIAQGVKDVIDASSTKDE